MSESGEQALLFSPYRKLSHRDPSTRVSEARASGEAFERLSAHEGDDGLGESTGRQDLGASTSCAPPGSPKNTTHVLHVDARLLARSALHQNTSIAVQQNAHPWCSSTSFASSTTRSTAHSSESPSSTPRKGSSAQLFVGGVDGRC